MLTNEDLDLAIRLLRDSVAIQLILVVPAGIFLLVHAPLVIALWLGTIDPTIVSAMRAFTCALIVAALGMPFYWPHKPVGRLAFWAGLGW